MKRILFFVLFCGVLIAACAPAPTPAPSATLTASPIPPTQTATLEPTATATATITETATPLSTDTPTVTPTAASTETIGEMLQTHIVFYLIVPEKGRTDACGDFTLEPIISQRLRSGDKLYDVQVALNMLFSVGTQFFGAYYNALWETDLTINTFEYVAQSDYAIIDFGGSLPVTQMTDCDKHGVKEQIWKTFYHYSFKEKTFTINGKFLIDQLGR
jgi:hypothetical protein